MKKIPTDLTGYFDSPFKDISELFNIVNETTTKREIERLESLLVYYTSTKIERELSVSKILDELLTIDLYLASEVGKNLAITHPATYGKIDFCRSLLFNACRYTSIHHVEKVLAKYSDDGLKAIQLIHNSGEKGLTLNEILDNFEDESKHLSICAMLTDLKDCELITDLNDIRLYPNAKSISNVPFHHPKRYVTINYDIITNRFIAKLANILLKGE